MSHAISHHSNKSRPIKNQLGREGGGGAGRE